MLQYKGKRGLFNLQQAFYDQVKMHVLAITAVFMSLSAFGASVVPPPETLLMPAFPPPVDLNANSNFQSTASRLSSALQEALNEGLTAFGNFTPNATSVSVVLRSTAQESPLFDFQFTGANLNTSAGSTSRISGDSVFRIGSVSKLLTVYALLLHGGLDHWEQPVTKYIPELKSYADHFGNGSEINYVKWEEVTIGALSSQMSGIGTNCKLRVPIFN
jgi:CubicO group peptidase (beta-lactamase class C family)